MRIIILGGIFLAAALGPAVAETIDMICANPRQEYQVRFNLELRTFEAEDTGYRVLAIEKSEDLFVVMGHTVAEGPFFRAHFHPYKKIEFFSNSALPFQTDGCKS